MSRIKIDKYTSSEYEGPILTLFKQAILVAWGSIDNKSHTYARISDHTYVGIIPKWFIDDANEGFYRAMLRKDREK